MGSLKEVRVLLCDWSGVVSNDIRLAYEANKSMLEMHGLPPPTYDEWLADMTWADPVSFFRVHGITITHAEVYATYIRLFRALIEDGHRPTAYPRIVEFFAEASQGRRIAVVSKHPQEFLDVEAAEYGLNGYVHELHGGVNDKVETVNAILATHGIKREHAAYVGDMTFDVDVARRAGILAVGVASGYHSRKRLAESNPDVIVDAIGDLIPHL